MIGAAEEIKWLDELTATITVPEGTILDEETIEGITLDTDDWMTEGTTLDADDGMTEIARLDAEVETSWLTELLTRAGEVAEDTAFEPGEES